MTAQRRDVIADYEAGVREWSGRLDRFCAELQQLGFQIDRDGLTVRIKAPAPGGSDGAA